MGSVPAVARLSRFQIAAAAVATTVQVVVAGLVWFAALRAIWPEFDEDRLREAALRFVWPQEAALLLAWLQEAAAQLLSLTGPQRYRAALDTLEFALLSAIGQVALGLVLCVSIRVVARTKWRQAAFEALVVAAYCAQPAWVYRLFVVDMGLSPESNWTLLLAAIWQFAPFSMVFFSLRLDQVREPERWLACCDSVSPLLRWHQVEWRALAPLAGALVGIRFLWMCTKYDLPSVFQDAWESSRLLLAVRVGQGAGHERDMAWAIVTGLTVVVALVVGIVARQVFGILRRPVRGLEEVGVGGALGSWWSPRLGRVLSPTILFAYLLPVALAVWRYLFQGHWPSLALKSAGFTASIGLFVGGTAMLLSLATAHVAARAGSAFGIGWQVVKWTTYSLPAAVLALVASRWGTWLSHVALHASDKLRDLVGLHGLDDLLLHLGAVVVAIAAYAAFCFPFAFLIIKQFLDPTERRNAEDLALVDGVRGFLMFRRVVWKLALAEVLLAGYFCCVIVSQDLAVPMRLDSIGHLFFSDQLKRAMLNEGESVRGTFGLATAFMLVFGFGFFVLRLRLRAAQAREGGLP